MPRQKRKQRKVFKRAGRKHYKAKIKRNVPTGCYLFKRWVGISNITLFNSSASVGTIAASANYLVCSSTAAAATPAYFSFGIGFRLEDVPNATEFSTLFDRYKLCGVKFRLIPIATSTENPYSVGGADYRSAGGQLHICTDKDDYTTAAGSESGVDALRQCQDTYKVFNLSQKKIDVYLRPKLIGVAIAAGTAAQGLATEGWLNSDTRTFAHAGLKAVIEIMQPFARAIDYYYKVECKYYMAFRDPR